MTRRADRGLLATAFGVYCAAFLVFLLAGGRPGDAGKAFVTDVGFLPAGLLATLLAWRASRAPGIAAEARRAWVSLALAFVSYLLGDTLWLVYEIVLKTPPSPSPASLFYLAYYPFFLFGLLRFPTVLEDRSRRIEFWLDATIVLLGGSMVVWHFVIGPAAALGRSTALASVLYLAFAVGDLVLLLAAAVTILSRPEDPARRAFLWLVTGLVVELVGDLIQGRNALEGVVASGGVADALFMAHWFCYGMSGHVFRRLAQQGPSVTGEGPPRAFNLLPYTAAVVGYGVLIEAWRAIGRRGSAPWWGAPSPSPAWCSRGRRWPSARTCVSRASRPRGRARCGSGPWCRTRPT